MSSIISNDKITLRALEPTDIDVLYKWENDSSQWETSGTTAPFSRQVLWQYLQSYTANLWESHEVRFMLTLTEDGTPIGTADVYDFDPANNRAQLGLFIANEFRRQGLGLEAAQILSDYASQVVGLRQLYIITSTKNEACIALFSKLGYTVAGTLRSWYRQGSEYSDAIVLQRLF